LLTTVALREAIRLEHRCRPGADARHHHRNDEPGEPVDPRDELRLRELLADAGAVINAAQPSERQARILGLRIVGYSYDEISRRTGDSHRTMLGVAVVALVAIGAIAVGQSRLVRAQA
jgi:DNA-directed RNA polymerase specialized sigma24 family protein